MDFVCLAAGQGTRLGRLGSYLQKCMYPVGLKPFLEYTLEQLVACRAEQVTGDRLTLVVGHLAHQVRAYFGSEFSGMPIRYVEQTERRGTGHALSLAHQAIRPRASVVAWQADMFVTGKMFAGVIDHPDDTVFTLGPGHPDEPAVLRATVEGDRVTRVWQGAGPLLDIGLWKLAPDVLARIGNCARERRGQDAGQPATGHRRRRSGGVRGMCRLDPPRGHPAQPGGEREHRSGKAGRPRGIP